MSFMSKLKRKRNQPSPSKSPPVVAAAKDQKHVYVAPKSPEPELNLPSPTHAVEIQSIFTGLKLSAEVASNEGGQSPYMQRVTTEESEVSEDASSSFSFLKQELSVDADPGQSPGYDEKSPFGFISQDVTQEPPSTFSFLNTPSESHDAPTETHDIPTESHDIPTGSHDISIRSHDMTTVSHETITGSHDGVNESPDLEVTLAELKSQPRKMSHPIVEPSGPSVAKQLAPVGRRKKKKKAVRPGQSAQEELSDLDTLSLSSHASSLEGTQPDAIDGKTTPLSPGPMSDVTPPQDETLETENLRKESTNQIEESQSHDETAELVKISPSESKNDVTMVTENEHTTSTTSETMTTKEPVEPVSLATDIADLSTVFVAPNYEIELSARDCLTALLEGYQSGLDNIRSGLSVSSEGVRATVDEQLSCAEELVERRKLVSELKSQQAAALAEEDYEQAELINSKLEETVLTREWVIADSCLQAVSKWMVKCCEADESEVKFREDMQTKVLSLQEEQGRALVDLDKEHSSKIAKDKLKIQAMEDKLQREKGHLALDQEHLDRSEQVLQEMVQRKAADFFARKETLEEELTSVQTEISLLEAKLTALQQQRKTITENILVQETEIAGVENELSAERSQLELEREGITVRETHLDKEQERISEEKAQVETVHNELGLSRQVLADLLERARSVSEDFDKRVNGLKQYKQEMECLQRIMEHGKTLLAPSDKLASLLESCTMKSSEVDLCTSGVLSAQSELSQLRKEVADLEGQVPQLTDSKKAAVTGRQFKEASRIAGELKTVSTKLEQVKGQISIADCKLSSLNNQLTKLSEELEVVKNETNALEKDEDEHHLSELLANCDLLLEISGRLEGSSLQGVVRGWSDLYTLLADDLATKHSLHLADYRQSKGEGHVGVVTSLQATPEEALQERTPGVGKEEEPSEATPAANETTPTMENDHLVELEHEIEAACEVEDYDKAAELEEKLQMLKQAS